MTEASGDAEQSPPAFYSPSWPVETAANGIVTYVAAITEALRSLGCRPCILAGRVDGDAGRPDVYAVNEERRPNGAAMMERVLFRIRPSAALRRRMIGHLASAGRRAMAERGITVLEMEETFGLAHAVRRELGIALVVRLHGPYFATLAGAVDGRSEARERLRNEGAAIAEADAVSAPSREILERTRNYYGLPLENAAVIPNPAPAVAREQRWRLTDCDRNAILFVGRFDRVKGGDVMIDAFRRVAAVFPQARLWFAGSDRGFLDEAGRNWTGTEYLAERAPQIANRVVWLGAMPKGEVEKLRLRAMTTVVASRYETFGMTALEAMAQGCPLAVTSAGGIPELVEDGANGLLCRPGEAEDLAAAIGRLLGDPELAARLGETAGQDAARRHDAKAIARETMEFHRAMIERRAKRGRATA